MYFCTNDVHVPRFPHPRFRGQSGMGLRGDAIVQFDWAVGQLMETLDKLGIADNTIILLSSDNGPVIDDGYQDQAAELLNGHKPAGPWRGNKYSAYEGGTAVPMIVRWPGKVKSGQTSATLTSKTDSATGSVPTIPTVRMYSNWHITDACRCAPASGNTLNRATDRRFSAGLRAWRQVANSNRSSTTSRIMCGRRRM